MKKMILMLTFMLALFTAPTFAQDIGAPPKTEQTQPTISEDLSTPTAAEVPAPTIETTVTQEPAKTDYGNGWVSFVITCAILILLIPFVCQFVTMAIPATGLGKQIMCWVVGIAITFILWLIPVGYLVGMPWPVTLFYGWIMALAGNGLYDTGLLNWMKPKKKQ